MLKKLSKTLKVIPANTYKPNYLGWLSNGWVKFVSILSLCLISAFTQPSFAFGQDKIATDIQTQYSFRQEWAQVSHQITLTNTESASYIQEYAIQLPEQITNVQIDQESTEINYQVNQNDQGTILQLKIIEPVIGKDKGISFDLNYQQPDLADRFGQVGYIIIPPFADNFAQGVRTREAIVEVPSDWPELTQIYPQPSSVLESDLVRRYRYDAELDLDSGITALFGKKQAIDLKLEYQLVNNTPNESIQDIVLPSDTAFQRVFIKQIQPTPLEFYQDVDGNMMASFIVEANQEFPVTAEFWLNRYHTPQPTHPITSNQEYTKQASGWAKTDSQIQRIVSDFDTPDQVFQYLLDTASFNFHRPDISQARDSADVLINQKDNLSCAELVDLSVTLLRAKDIPARAVIGYVYPQVSQFRPNCFSQDNLHLWVEYFDPQTQSWQTYDPTWDISSLGAWSNIPDLHRFSLAIYGQSRSEPSLTNLNFNTINVDYLETEFTYPKQVRHYQLEPNLLAFFGLPIRHNLTIENNSGASLYNPITRLESDSLNISWDQQTNWIVPPYSRLSLPVKIKLNQFATNQHQINLTDEQERHTLDYSFDPRQLILLGFAGFLGLAGVASATAYFSWRIFFSK